MELDSRDAPGGWCWSPLPEDDCGIGRLCRSSASQGTSTSRFTRRQV